MITSLCCNSIRLKTTESVENMPSKVISQHQMNPLVIFFHQQHVHVKTTHALVFITLCSGSLSMFYPPGEVLAAMARFAHSFTHIQVDSLKHWLEKSQLLLQHVGKNVEIAAKVGTYFCYYCQSVWSSHSRYRYCKILLWLLCEMKFIASDYLQA